MTVDPNNFVPVSEFRAKMPNYLEQLKNGPVYLLNNNKLVAAITGIEEHNALRAKGEQRDITPPLSDSVRYPDRPYSLSQIEGPSLSVPDDGTLNVVVGTRTDESAAPYALDLLHGRGTTLIEAEDRSTAQVMSMAVLLSLCLAYSSSDVSVTLNVSEADLLGRVIDLPHCAGISSGRPQKGDHDSALKDEILYRRSLLREGHCTNISEYRARYPHPKKDLPYLVVFDLDQRSFPRVGGQNLSQLGMALIVTDRDARILASPHNHLSFYNTYSACHNRADMFLPSDNSLMNVMLKKNHSEIVVPLCWDAPYAVIDEEEESDRTAVSENAAPYNTAMVDLFRAGSSGDHLVKSVCVKEHPVVRARRFWTPDLPEKIAFGQYLQAQLVEGTPSLFDERETVAAMGVRISEENKLRAVPAPIQGTWRYEQGREHPAKNGPEYLMCSTVLAHAAQQDPRVWVIVPSARTASYPWCRELTQLPTVVVAGEGEVREVLDGLSAGARVTPFDREATFMYLIGDDLPTVEGPIPTALQERGEREERNASLLVLQDVDAPWFDRGATPTPAVLCGGVDGRLFTPWDDPEKVFGQVFAPVPDLGYLRHGKELDGLHRMCGQVADLLTDWPHEKAAEWWARQKR